MAINDDLCANWGTQGSFNDKMQAYQRAISEMPAGGRSPDGLSPFWGINGHITWSWSPNAAGYFKSNWAWQCLRLRDLGISTYRNGYSWYYNDTTHVRTGSDASVFVDFITNYANPAGLKVAPALLPSYDKSWLVDEATAYTFAVDAGTEVATALKGLVPYYEVGNELEVWPLTGRGTWRGDYDITKFRILRGIVRGLIAGIKSVDPKAKIAGPSGTWIHTAFFDNLLLGQEPDGSLGHPKVDWDYTCWHWYVNNYAPNDDPEYESQQGPFRLLDHLASWGKPILLNEFGCRWNSYGSNETNATNAIIGQYCADTLYKVRGKYNIQHMSYYQLIDAAPANALDTGDELNFGLIGKDGTTQKARYAALKNFIASHR